MQYPPVGVRVLVPLGRKSITGIVYRQHEGELPATIKVRDVIDVLDEQPVVTAEQLRLWGWLAQYYMCTLGEVLSAALPSGIIDDDYKALTTQYIQLSPTHLDPRQQELTLSLLSRAKSQHKLLETFLSMSRNQNTGMPDAGYPMPVERRALLEASGVGIAPPRAVRLRRKEKAPACGLSSAVIYRCYSPTPCFGPSAATGCECYSTAVAGQTGYAAAWSDFEW